jgi:hypothetical protein
MEFLRPTEGVARRVKEASDLLDLCRALALAGKAHDR